MSIVTRFFVQQVAQEDACDLSGTDDQLIENILIPSAEQALRDFLEYDPEQATISNDRGLGMFSGNGYRLLYLPKLPVYSITDIWVDGGAFFGDGANPWPSATKLTKGSDYVLITDGVDSAGTAISQMGKVLRLGWNRVGIQERAFGFDTRPVTGIARFEHNDADGWWWGTGNIRVDYVAGYPSSAMPEPLKLAVAYAVLDHKDAAGGTTEVESAKLGDLSVDFGSTTERSDRVGTTNTVNLRLPPRSVKLAAPFKKPEPAVS